MNKMIDSLLDKVTMYRLVLYFLLVLIGWASVLGLFGVIQYSPLSIILSTAFLISASWIMNKIMSWAFDAPTNVESVYITALILALIVSPASSLGEVMVLGWVAVLAISSKYILAIKKKHIFNPAAIAVVLISIAGIGSASWWVGTLWMLPVVLVGGYLIIRKLQFEDMVWSFLFVSVVASLTIALIQGGDILKTLQQVLISSPLFFLGGVMLTEPMTLPPTKNLKIVFGGIVGFLTVPFIHLFSFSFTPELALIIGNIFAYLVSSKQKLILHLEQKIRVSPDIIDFIFTPQEKLAYVPGQYMEWTLPHNDTDSRGNRRFFTLASSPTEPNLRLGVKFYHQGSSYKKALWNIDSKTPLVGAQLAGDFTLPTDSAKKLVFIAGGIGVTPFRSMLKYLVDKNEKRDIVLFFSNKTADEIVYKDVFNDARTKLGIETIYSLTKTDSIPANWNGARGRVDGTMISAAVPDFLKRTFYLSGPFQMISAVEEELKNIGVKKSQIKKDFFPGLV